MRSDYSSMTAAFSVGNLELARWVMKEVGMRPEGHLALHTAAAAGHAETLQWFQDKGICAEWDTGALVLAAEAGQLEVVQWMLDRDRKDDKLKYEDDPDPRYDHEARCIFLTCLGGEASLAIHSAAVNGHLEVAKLLHANSDKPRNQAEKDTEMRGRRKWINELSRRYERGCRPKDAISEIAGETMMLAAERGFLDVVKWLYTQYQADRTMNLVWVRGHVDEHGYSGNVDIYDCTKSGFCSVVDAAAGNGHLEVVQYLLQVGGGNADGGGNAEDEQAPKKRRTDTYPDLSLRYKMPVKAGCTTAAMDVAAAHGHLEVVQWLHSNCSEGCTTAAMDHAVQNGHLETVKWLHANRKEGCTVDAMNTAAIGGHLHVIKWLHEHTSEGCTTDAMDIAAGEGHFELLKWLHENRTEGCTVAAMDGAAAGNHFDIVKWLHKRRAKCRTLAIDGAAHGGHLRLLRWLFENRKEGFTSKAIDNALQFAELNAADIAQHRTARACKGYQRHGCRSVGSLDC